jgi:dTDP-4-amino-4,6-dideoxygalactose transaminase
LAKKIKLMRSHGMTTLTWDRHQGHAHSYDVLALGYNYRLDEIRAAIGLEQLKKLPVNNQRRGEIMMQYRRALDGQTGVTLPFRSPHGQSSFHICPIVLDPNVDRGAFTQAMRAKGIQTSIHYPPIHQFTYYRQHVHGAGTALPHTDEIGKREVTLPLFPGLTEEKVQIVIGAVQEAIERSSGNE